MRELLQVFCFSGLLCCAITAQNQKASDTPTTSNSQSPLPVAPSSEDGATPVVVPYADWNPDAVEQIGTVNGQPVFLIKDHAAIAFANRYNRQPTPEDQQQIAILAVKNVCSRMEAHIRGAAQGQVRRQFSVSVTPEEVAQATETVLAGTNPTPAWIAWQKRWTTYNEAAHQVFDLHQDPEHVYQKLIAPLEENQERGHKAWEGNLVQWSTPGGRAQLAKIAQSSEKWTPARMNQTIATNAQLSLEQRKMDDAVDTQIAAGDSQFSSYLEEWRKSAADVSPSERRSAHDPLPFERRSSPSYPSDHLAYLNQKRHEFWMARYAEQQITFTDPKAAGHCTWF